ncbi:MAG: helix-turn-helix transcriptional regulator [Dethiobacter sp.]|nr:helix-turn-helix transcriptional regulator [Dethiobacter sp.]MBS4007216.1 helix-turn-helix transcriptional regulator [Clostridium sp.]
MKDLFEQIGDKIQLYLEENKMSQTELAEKFGVSKQVMSKIVHGKKAINVIEVSKLASIMNVSFDYLMKYEEHQIINPVFVMMGSVSKPNTKDDLRFLDHVMDEMVELTNLLQNQVE